MDSQQSGRAWVLGIGVVGILGLTGCGSKYSDLGWTPKSLDWGEVDFYNGVPDEGFDPKDLAITNKGDTAVEVTISTFDFDHLCLAGFTTTPVVLDTLEPDETYTLVVSVCDYSAEDGERDTLVTGEIRFAAEGAETEDAVPWEFTPVLGFEEDHGDAGQ